MLFGVLSGLGAAVGQSLSYLATRHFVQSRPGRGGMAARQLLVLAHVWMFLFAVVMLPLCWPAGVVVPWGKIFWPTVWNVVLYISGQMGLSVALKHAEASRVSPLMTSKLILSSVLVMLFGQPVGPGSGALTGLQWFAVAVCIGAALSINFAGGRMRRRAVLAIVWAAASFSLSDWNINLTIQAFLTAPGMDRLRASLLTQAFAYVGSGVVAVPLLWWFGSRKGRDWVDSLPFALTWFLAMVGLFSAFAAVGILLGTILQCTRSFITILLAMMLMRRGHHHIEPPATRGTVVRRLGAGFGMFVGITLYVLKDFGVIRGWLGL